MARRRKDREFWESADLNVASYIQYYDRLTELSISMFEWRNLPETVDPRFLELTLFANGMAVFSRMMLMNIWHFNVQLVDHLMCTEYRSGEGHTLSTVLIRNWIIQIA